MFVVVIVCVALRIPAGCVDDVCCCGWCMLVDVLLCVVVAELCWLL